MGVMAGALDLIQRGYMGAEIQDGMLCFSLKPNEADGLSFPLAPKDASRDRAQRGQPDGC